jgi:hypothetical protein
VSVEDGAVFVAAAAEGDVFGGSEDVGSAAVVEGTLDGD